MILYTRGLVLRQVKYSETSIIVDVFTEVLGKKTYILNGIRSSKSKMSINIWQPMSLLELTAYNQATKNINRIIEAQPDYIYNTIPFDIKRSAVGILMIEVAQKSIREEEANPELFNFLRDSFILLDNIGEGVANFHLLFLMQLTGYLGFFPNEDSYQENYYFDLQTGRYVSEMPKHPHYLIPEWAVFWYKLQRTALTQAGSVSLHHIQRRYLLDRILHFYKFHIDNLKEINSHHIFQEIFE